MFDHVIISCTQGKYIFLSYSVSMEAIRGWYPTPPPPPRYFVLCFSNLEEVVLPHLSTWNPTRAYRCGHVSLISEFGPQFGRDGYMGYMALRLFENDKKTPPPSLSLSISRWTHVSKSLNHFTLILFRITEWIYTEDLITLICRFFKLIFFFFFFRKRSHEQLY